jgi:hypothetical protein
VDFNDACEGMSDEEFVFNGGENEDDIGVDDSFIVDGEEDSNNDQDGDHQLNGFEDLYVHGDAPDQDEDHPQGPTAKPARPAFHQRSNKAAERSALRSKFEEADALIIHEDGETLTAAPNRVPGTWGRRNREKGSTLPAYHKKVSYELDSDDELMMEMREQGYTDRQIADKLANDNRVRYDSKSIATRVGRIRAAQVEHVDYLLKEGYKEWRLKDVS